MSKYVVIHDNEIIDKQVLCLDNVQKSIEKAHRFLDYQHYPNDTYNRLCNAGYSIEEDLVYFIIITHTELYRNSVYNRIYNNYEHLIIHSEREDKISDILE
jgi:hypothetical protein